MALSQPKGDSSLTPLSRNQNAPRSFSYPFRRNRPENFRTREPVAPRIFSINEVEIRTLPSPNITTPNTIMLSDRSHDFSASISFLGTSGDLENIAYDLPGSYMESDEMFPALRMTLFIVRRARRIEAEYRKIHGMQDEVSEKVTDALSGYRRDGRYAFYIHDDCGETKESPESRRPGRPQRPGVHVKVDVRKGSNMEQLLQSAMERLAVKKNQYLHSKQS